MQLVDGRLVYSATDLVGFLECAHLANLERAVVEGHLKRPMRSDPVLDRIAQRGRDHEQRFLEGLIAAGVSSVDLEIDHGVPFTERIARGAAATVEAMRAGAEVIYQATLFDGRRLGYADFLRRVETPSDLGSWSYEVWDTKLARHAKASAVLQIGLYSEMVGAIQGCPPQAMHLALGGVARETVSFRVADYAAYVRLVAREFEDLLAERSTAFPVASSPAPVEHCEVCRWAVECRAELRAADDLALVANLTGRQRHALHGIGVTTRLGLAEPAEPLPPRLDGAGREALARIHAQASIQVRGEREGSTLSERIPPARDREGAFVPDTGLAMLPPPSPGDLFFDIEGDPFFGSDEVDGIDYLFGVAEGGRRDARDMPAFRAFWAVEGGSVTPAAERRAFEAFIDFVMTSLEADPALHVYHYAPYEPTAMKRLASRYGTREQEVDRLLRGGVFVDLYRAVRQSIRASVESYSIKRLEPLYGFVRDINLRDAASSIVEFETWLELGDGDERGELLGEIEQYNRDDCNSTLALRDWLEAQRAALEAELGEALPRPTAVPAEEAEDSEAQQAVQALVDQLTAGLPEDAGDRTAEERGRWLLAQLLGYHRREMKSFWWRYFQLLRECTDEERREQPDALGELTFERSWVDPTPRTRSTFYRFRFPPQDHQIRVGNVPHDQTGKSAGTVTFIDDEEGIIDLRIGTSAPAPTPTSLIPHDLVRPAPKPEALQALARWVIEQGVDAPGLSRAARDLLLRRAPRAGQPEGAPLAVPGEDAQAAARRIGALLDESYLAIQGPPGSGKSSVGAEMIVDLVAAGRRVGVTATSHKVIGELLAKAAEVARKRGLAIAIGHRGPEEQVWAGATPLASTAAAHGALTDGSCAVVGGTAWLWAAEEMVEAVDVLFVDEAGQMALADVLAAARAARNLVLLGDPQQLDQVLQGTHPPGAERSALAHVLDGAHVMPAHLGLFLDGSWRLHPQISAFTSEVFYDGRLHSHSGRDRLDLRGAAPLSGTGIRFIEVPHSEHSSDSPEEAAAIAEAVRRLIAAEPTWVDARGDERPLAPDDVLLITPYNAQVAALTAALPGLRIGTVDKFQGQEAPVSIYSMATSSAEDAPRGMEFLYSLNRLNVATSRAQCLAVVVASPGLLHVRCRTPRQMQLANALARLVEVATPA